MASLPEVRKGFMKFSRQGPVKSVKQKNNDRAPEKYGLWAFPYPYFDVFFTYHRYIESAPKHLRGRRPTDPKYWLRDSDDQPVESLEGYELNEWGFYDDIYVAPEWHKEQQEWIEKVGKRIERRTVFWYRGPIYTHIGPRKQIADHWTGESEWFLTDTRDLYSRILRVGGNTGREAGVTFPCSVDHLEVFIPRGGEYRTRL